LVDSLQQLALDPAAGSSVRSSSAGSGDGSVGNPVVMAGGGAVSARSLSQSLDREPSHHTSASSGSGASDDEKCPMCLRKGAYLWRSPCGHVLHLNCAMIYYSKNTDKVICPTCRGVVRSSHGDLLAIYPEIAAGMVNVFTPTAAPNIENVSADDEPHDEQCSFCNRQLRVDVYIYNCEQCEHAYGECCRDMLQYCDYCVEEAHEGEYEMETDGYCGNCRTLCEDCDKTLCDDHYTDHEPCYRQCEICGRKDRGENGFRECTRCEKWFCLGRHQCDVVHRSYEHIDGEFCRECDEYYDRFILPRFHHEDNITIGEELFRYGCRQCIADFDEGKEKCRRCGFNYRDGTHPLNEEPLVQVEEEIEDDGEEDA